MSEHHPKFNLRHREPDISCENLEGYLRTKDTPLRPWGGVLRHRPGMGGQDMCDYESD